jgi:phospholipid/cholesterol/gamma-HCH transport system substrate-binding protein
MSTEAKVGAFLIVSLLVLGATVYFVDTTQNVKGQVAFKTYLRYAGGLAPGAAVLFGGIKVGQVTAVGPSTEDPTRIKIVFDVKRDTPVNQNSTARVGSVSVMSTPVLQITTGSNDARRLKAGDVVPSEEAVSLDEISRDIGKVAESANELMTELRREIPGLTDQARTAFANVNAITGLPNQKRNEGILAELNTMLNRESPRIAQITHQISELAKHADSVVVSAKPVLPNIDRTVTNVNNMVDEIRPPLKKSVTELESAVQDARALLVSVRHVVGANEEEMAETVRNLRATSENLRDLSETVKQRPWNLIRTTQPPDRKVPQ